MIVLQCLKGVCGDILITMSEYPPSTPIRTRDLGLTPPANPQMASRPTTAVKVFIVLYYLTRSEITVVLQLMSAAYLSAWGCYHLGVGKKTEVYE